MKAFWKILNESNIEIETASATLEIERQNIGQIKTIFEWE